MVKGREWAMALDLLRMVCSCSCHKQTSEPGEAGICYRHVGIWWFRKHDTYQQHSYVPYGYDLCSLNTTSMLRPKRTTPDPSTFILFDLCSGCSLLPIVVESILKYRVADRQRCSDEESRPHTGRNRYDQLTIKSVMTV